MATPFARAHPWAWVLLSVPTLASGQGATRVRVEENLRRTPNGEVLARLAPGAGLGVVGGDEAWVEVDLEGWVWTQSLEASPDPELGLVVSQQGGENLRRTPNGEIVGQVLEGMLLEEVARQPGWAQVRRRGWIWRESVLEIAAAPADAGGEPPHDARADPSGPEAMRVFVEVGEVGGAILDTPDGDTLARAVPRAQVQVMAREGNWARVRLEGWAWLPPGDSAAPVVTVAEGLTPSDLAGEPGGYRGRIVSWSLQFISLERAEQVRTDFFEGEPFILARWVDSDGPFVYVAVPPERLAEVEGLAPLEQIAVTGRVRTGASALTGTPIVDLLALERARDAG